jgi:hypothetical protein
MDKLLISQTHDDIIESPRINIEILHRIANDIRRKYQDGETRYNLSDLDLIMEISAFKRVQDMTLIHFLITLYVDFTFNEKTRR